MSHELIHMRMSHELTHIQTYFGDVCKRRTRREHKINEAEVSTRKPEKTVFVFYRLCVCVCVCV